MTEPKSQNEKPENERRYDPELLEKGLRCDVDQYEMLIQWLESNDRTKWNEWRKNHLGESILLEGADFSGLNLNGIDLSDYRGIASAPRVSLKSAVLRHATLEGACLNRSDFQDTDLSEVNLVGASMQDACFKGATFQGTRLYGTYLMHGLYRRGACFDGSELQSGDFRRAIVDSSTSFWGCKLNRETDFRDVALESVQLEGSKKQLLEYNIRRKNWEEWYPKQNWLLAWVVRKFWEISDYGISTKRIIRTFISVSMVFAIIYYLFGAIEYYYFGISDNPGIVANLFVDENGPIEWCLVPIRSIYFSIVTMTTLGFGDMYANAHNYNWGWLGHIILSFQVILGYVLLGALITRFAVLFAAGGPAGKFADEKKKDNET
jgi:uncharacterized protein YjbI with pentapeptide repeats